MITVFGVLSLMTLVNLMNLCGALINHLTKKIAFNLQLTSTRFQVWFLRFSRDWREVGFVFWWILVKLDVEDFDLNFGHGGILIDLLLIGKQVKVLSFDCRTLEWFFCLKWLYTWITTCIVFLSIYYSNIICEFMMSKTS